MTLVTTAWPSILNGDEVDAPDLQGMGDAVRTLVANSISAIIGARAAMPMLNPLTVTAPGGMNILVGGTGGQSVYLDGASPVGARYVDNAPVQTIALASASTQPRNDLLCAQYNQTLTTVGTRNNKSTGGTISTVTSNVENESLVYQIVTGTPASSPVDPAVPSGYVAIARISVPASASTIVSGNIAILPPTMQSLILEPITANGFVDLVNNQTISGNKTFSGVTTIGGIEFASGDTPYSSVAGVRLNGVGSIIISPTATGNAIYLGYDCSTLASVNFGPTNAWGYVGSDGYHSPGNISVYGTDANVGGTAVVAGGVRIGSSASAISNAGDLYIARNASPTTAYVFYGTGGKFLGYDGSVMSTNAGISSGGNGFFSGTLTVNSALTSASISATGTILASGGARVGSSSSAIANPGDICIARNASPTTAYVFYGTGGTFLGFDGSVMSTNAGISSGGAGFFNGSVTATGGAKFGTSAPAISNAGDICIARNASPTTAYVFYGTGGTFLGFDGTNLSTNVGFSSAGNGFFGGSLTVSSSLTLNGSSLPNAFASPDSSVTISRSGQTLNLALPSGFIDSFVSDGSIGITQTGRQLEIVAEGLAFSAQVRPTSSSFTETLTLPTLPGNSSVVYNLKATFVMGDLVGGGMTMTGSGATWEASSITENDAGQVMMQTIDYIGTATGGQTPSVQLVSTVPSIDFPHYIGVFELTAKHQ